MHFRLMTSDSSGNDLMMTPIDCPDGQRSRVQQLGHLSQSLDSSIPGSVYHPDWSGGRQFGLASDRECLARVTLDQWADPARVRSIDDALSLLRKVLHQRHH